MNFSKMNACLCIAGCLLAPLVAQAAQPITQPEDPSIELTNLDLSDTALPTATADQTADGQAAAPGMVQTQTAPDGQGVSQAEAATPMEQYRDMKLHKASTPHGVNPASVRRYLKVDRSTYLDSTGVQ